MDKYAVLFNYFRQCPYLKNLMSIAAESNKGQTVILPQGASPAVQYQEEFDVNDTNPPQFNENVLTYQEVCGVCEWVKAQNEANNFPDIGEMIVSIETNPFVPQIRYVDPDTNTVGYFITVRLRYVNRTPRKTVEYEFTD